MSSVPRPPLPKRLPPGVWTASAWASATGCAVPAYAAMGYSIKTLPGPGFPDGYSYVSHPAAPHLLLLALAGALVLAGSALLRRVPLVALGFLLAGAVAGAAAFTWSHVESSAQTGVGVRTLFAPSAGFFEFLPAVVALYVIAAGRPRRTAVAALVAVLATMTCYLAALALAGFGIGTSAELPLALTGVVAWLVGRSGRQAREYAASLNAQAAAAERLRLSRDLHDSVAHSIGVIAVLAGAAGRVIETQPKEAREALAGIEMTSRQALTGLQRMLSALRRAEPGADGDAAPLVPAPGLTDLDQLAAQAAGAGVRVDVTWRGERRLLPPEIDLSAFRIIQEAVTNVVRHSGTHACRVDVGFEPDGLAIEIVDDGRGSAPAGRGGEGGFGLLGMRERVAMLSGQFSAGPRPDGGFRVAARLPA